MSVPWQEGQWSTCVIIVARYDRSAAVPLRYLGEDSTSTDLKHLPQNLRHNPKVPGRWALSWQIVEPGAVVPQELALGFLCQGHAQESLHCLGVFGVGVGVVGGEHDALF